MNNVLKSIGWCHWTINPVKGLCPMNCKNRFGKPYCYARKAYGRNCNEVFKDKTIRYDPTVFIDLYKAKKGDRIFVGSTIDLFHPLCSMWNDEIIDYCASERDLTFIFLTKCPQNLPKEFPDNCWVGVSATNNEQYRNADKYLSGVKAKIRFYSFEPLQEHINYGWYTPYYSGDWVIIGLQTPYSKLTAPQIADIKDIVEPCVNVGRPVFLKDNLYSLLIPENCKEPNVLSDDIFWASDKAKLRQEFPIVDK